MRQEIKGDAKREFMDWMKDEPEPEPKAAGIVSEAIARLKKGTWQDLRKIVEAAKVTRAELAAAVEWLSLRGTVGIDTTNPCFERIIHIPSAKEEDIARLYGSTPVFYRSKRGRGQKAHF